MVANLIQVIKAAFVGWSRVASALGMRECLPDDRGLVIGNFVAR